MENAIRDPVLKWIRFTEQEKGVIDSPLVQRLRWITQLTTNDQVFPGSHHSRFIHSIGVMKLSGKYIKHLLKKGKNYLPSPPEKPNEYWIRLARMAGLLHDIGHGPFSHAFDRVVYKDLYGMEDGGHDMHRLMLIEHPILANPIKEAGIDPKELEKVWTATIDSPWMYFIIKLIVGGPLGADRMDFILRDSYFSGTPHLGTIALRRIMHNSRIKFHPTLQNWRLCYGFKAIHDIVQALNGRRFMYHGVYLHKTVDASSLLVENMLAKSVTDLKLIEKVLDVDQFLFLNEANIIGQMLALPEEHEAKIECKKLLMRKLPKMKEEELVDGKKVFIEEEWKEKWNVTEKQKLKKTRCITGIDPFKFSQYQVFFYKNNSEKLIDCEQALEDARFEAIKPYYIVRLFE